MNKTPIEWCTHTVNPFRARNKGTGKTGHFCAKISPGCKFCYSSRLQPRFGLFPFLAENRSKVDLCLDEPTLHKVIRQRKPARIFWCDMTDMFLDDYPDHWIDACFAVMGLTPWHTHLVLTKRDKRLAQYFRGDWLASRITAWQWQFIENLVDPNNRRSGDIRAVALDPDEDWPFPNVHLGVSVENRDYKTRIDILREVPAAHRFISAEPLIEDLGDIDLRGISQVIVGGESGPGARPFNIAWARAVVAQCKAAGVRCFVKQLGANPVDTCRSCKENSRGFCRHHGSTRKYDGYEGHGSDGLMPLALKDRKGGNWDEWPADLRVREYPKEVLLDAR